MPLTKEGNHFGKMLLRLSEQFKDKPKIASLFRAIAAQAQAIEHALFDLFSKRGPSNAEGAQMDRLGKVVGQVRQGADDPTYALYIKARTKLNRSSGTIEDIVAVFHAVHPTATIRVVEGPPAGFNVRIEGVTLTPAEADAMVRFLREAKSGGVYATLEYFASAPGDAMIWGSSEPARVWGVGRYSGSIS